MKTRRVLLASRSSLSKSWVRLEYRMVKVKVRKDVITMNRAAAVAVCQTIPGRLGSDWMRSNTKAMRSEAAMAVMAAATEVANRLPSPLLVALEATAGIRVQRILAFRGSDDA
jgi:hypothetical protein